MTYLQMVMEKEDRDVKVLAGLWPDQMKYIPGKRWLVFVIHGIITMRKVECSRKVYTFTEGLLPALLAMIFFLDVHNKG